LRTEKVILHPDLSKGDIMPRFFNYAFICLLLLPATAISAELAPLIAKEPVVTKKTDTSTSDPLLLKESKKAPVVRVGYADLLKIAEKSDAGKIAKTHFEAKADRLKAQLETKQKLLEKQKATLEAKLPTYSPEQRTAKIKDYEKKVEELRKMLIKADQELKPMQEELIKDIYGKIEKVAREYGARKGFSVLLEKRELLYLGADVEAEDVTDALIAELNAKPVQ
jgi:outer membrane protein